MAQHFKPPLAMPTFHIGAPVQVWGVPLLIQHPAAVPEKIADHGPCASFPVTYVKDLDGVPAS